MKITNKCDTGFKWRESMVIIVILTMFFVISIGLSGSGVRAEATAATTSSDGIIVVYKDGTSVSEIKKQLIAKDSATDEISKADSNTRYAVADVPEDQTVRETIKDYEKSSIVEYAQPNYLYKAYSNDTYYSELWHLSKIGATTAASYYSSLSSSKSTVKVAVLDTGVNISHVDLQSCLDKSLSVDITSSETGNYSALTKDVDDHGTHVTGIIAATANNSIGVAGVGASITNNNLDVFVENVFTYYKEDRREGIEAGYYADTDDIIKGVKYAISNNAKVINMSLGYWEYAGTACDSLLATALDSCESNGITVVCAAGNDGDDPYYATLPNYPADYKTCISVTATTSNNGHAYYSNYNKYKDIAAPGDEIYSTGSDGYYEYMSGTSMAAPVVTGVVAAMYSVNPDITPYQVRSILYGTATDLGDTGRDNYFGYGLVNAYKAVAVAEEGNTVFFNSNGGSTPSFAYAAVTSEGTVGEFPVTKRSGYTLSGWYTAASGGTKATESTAVSTSLTLYAHWTKVTVAKESIKSIKSSSRKVYTVAKAISGAKGYQLKYSRSKSFSGSKYLTRASVKITTGKLTKNKYYYVKVRAYKLDSKGSKVYGAWSAYKMIKIK